MRGSVWKASGQGKGRVRAWTRAREACPVNGRGRRLKPGARRAGVQSGGEQSAACGSEGA